MGTFNLVDERWIPAIRPDGSRKEFSLLDTLLGAHELREVVDPSPLVTVALHRLLLAVLHRCFGPASREVWRDLWTAGQFGAECVDAYLSTWRRRFDLFDTERPFYQVPRMFSQKASGKEVEQHPVQLLTQEAASGNNSTLFDHSREDRPAAMEPAAAARYLLARQEHSLGLGVSEPFNFRDSPLARGYTVLAIGDNLFQTLVLNMLVVTNDRPIPRAGDDDPPAWERQEVREPDPSGTLPSGYVDYLTLPSRRIHLVEDEDGQVRHCQVQQGFFIPKGAVLDPFMAYQRQEKEGWLPRGFQRDKTLWRDSVALMQTTEADASEGNRPVGVLGHLALIDQDRQDGRISARERYEISVIGWGTEPGKATSVILWRCERWPLPLAYLTDERLRGRLATALSLAEHVGKVVDRAARQYAVLMCIPKWDAMDKVTRRQAESNKEVKGRINNLRTELRPGLRYWPRLETAFRQLLISLPQDSQQEAGEVQFGAQTIPYWAAEVRSSARDAFRVVAEGAGSTPRSLKAAAVAQHAFNKGMHRALLGFEPAGKDDAQ